LSKIVKRTLDFFEVFAEHGRPLSLTEIARILNLPVSSCHDVLQSLQERGYVYEIAPRSGYYPSLKLQELANRIVVNDPVLARADIAMRAIRDELDESVLLARVDGITATYLLVKEPSYPLRFLRRVGDRLGNLHATSVGKALLGSLDERTRRKTVADLELTPLTERTHTSRDALLAEVEESQARGWYINREESEPTATTVSATFRWNRSVFIVTVAGPTFRMEKQVDQAVAALLKVCAELERPGASSARP
jgi:IclR family transcriptional regulator, acetate operon repressor